MSKIEDGSVNFEEPVEMKNNSEENKTRNGGVQGCWRGRCGQCKRRGTAFNCGSFVRRTCTVEALKRKLPIARWLPSYRLKELKGDLIAGLTLGLTVIPQSMAYAKIAELPTQYGLYTSFMCYFAYCLLGTARDVNLGPTAVLSLLTAEFTHQIPQLAALLAFICGIVQVIMGVLNIGFLMEFISHTIINSFTTAAALAIIFSQVKKWLGLKGIPRDFARQLYWTIIKIPETQLWDCFLGLICMCFLYLLKKLKVIKFRRSWAANLANFISTARNATTIFLASTVAAILFQYNHVPFTLTGNITSGIPSFSFPSPIIDLGNNVTLTASQSFQKIGIGSVITPLVGLIEAVAIGKAFGKKNGYKVDSDQEFLALGVSNILGSFVSAYPVTGSFSRSAVAAQSGIQTPAANIITGLLVLLALAFLTPMFYYIPTSGLAAVIIMAVTDLVDFSMIRKLWIINKPDLVPWFITFGISLLFGFEYGILIGVAVSLLFLLQPWAKPNVQISSLNEIFSEPESGDDNSPDAKLTKMDNIVVVTPSIGLLFPGGEHFEDKVFEKAKNGSLVFDFSSVMMMDFSAASCIKQLANDLSKRNTRFVFINLKPSVEEKLNKSEIKNFRSASSLSEAVKILRTVEKKDVVVDIVIDEDRFEVKSGEEVETVPLTHLSDASRQDDPVASDNVVQLDGNRKD